MDATKELRMAKAYEPQGVEQRLYEWWSRKGYFKPETQWEKGLAAHDAKPFVIAIPPPNVTGALHMGHALTMALEDLMIRYHRMKGQPTLWVPGTDHAGIATENVVERQLAKEGKQRKQMRREEFVSEVWKWKESYHARITKQLKRLGASCDWERERFTLDEGLSRAVRVAFVTLYEKGLIYRGLYLVNWCPHDRSVISELEVEHEEEQGKIWTVRYYLTGDDDQRTAAYIDVATTRPETILGDTAVAVNPEDDRYKHLVGRTAILPILGRHIPIIADTYVDSGFGTGAVKITPGHDPNDYEVGKRHNLPSINIMNQDGTLNEEAGPYAGMDRFAARTKLLEDLQAQGQVIEIKDHTLSIGRCEKCHTIVEPLLSEQWFVRMRPLAEPAIEAVKNGSIQIVPERFSKVYFNWMNNIRDWTISRQLWWGHRIPVWYCAECGKQTCAVLDPSQCAHCGSSAIQQDEDVLDTWFSSGLWPFSTLGWPEETEDLRRFYPTSTLETGYDILFFWVARMIMLGLEFTEQAPFDTVYLHGLVRDAQGRKMSKSLGNGIDPLETIEKYGCDALRYALLTGSTPGNDMKFSITRLESGRNFANKIWNAARFVIANLPKDASESNSSEGERITNPSTPNGLLVLNPSLADRWILSRLNRTIADATRLIDNHEYGEAGRRINDFIWGEVCDWYIEIAKGDLNSNDPAVAERVRNILAHLIDQSMRLLHPFMPFVTEEIWQNLKETTGIKGEALILAAWPQADTQWLDDQAEGDFDRLIETIRSIRNARAEYNVQPGKRIAAVIAAGDYTDLFKSQRAILASQAKLDDAALEIGDQLPAPAQAVALVAGGATTYLPLAGMVDLVAEQSRLSKELDAVLRELSRSTGLLSKESFTAKAPAEVVAKERAKVEELHTKQKQIEEQIAALKA